MSDDSFPARLRELREASGLGQKELAEKVGLSIRQVSRLETGESIPSWPTVVALASALGVDCTAFTQAPTGEQPEPKRGRPRKASEPGPADPGSGQAEVADEPKKSTRKRKSKE